MSKTAGVTLTIANADANITQTLTADGTTVTLEVVGESDQTKLVMSAGSLTIDCSKDFKLTADTITCSSTGASKYESKDTMALSSAKKMSLDSTGANIEQTASADVKVAGVNVALSGSSKVSAEAVTASISGSGKAEVSGAQVNVTATGQLNCESSGIATFKGSVTNVQGSLVNVG